MEKSYMSIDGEKFFRAIKESGHKAAEFGIKLGRSTAFAYDASRTGQIEASVFYGACWLLGATPETFITPKPKPREKVRKKEPEVKGAQEVDGGDVIARPPAKSSTQETDTAARNVNFAEHINKMDDIIAETRALKAEMLTMRKAVIDMGALNAEMLRVIREIGKELVTQTELAEEHKAATQKLEKTLGDKLEKLYGVIKYPSGHVIAAVK